MSYRLTQGCLEKQAETIIAAIEAHRPVAEMRLIVETAIREGYMDGYNYGVQKVRGTSDRLAVDL